MQRPKGSTSKFEQGDAEDMPYADDSFDPLMTCSRNVRTEAGGYCRELVRVCKPGGRIAMANWTPTGFAGQMFKLSTKYLPPPPMPPPVLWGVPDEVKARFADRVSGLEMTPRMADMQFDFPPEDVVELFKKYFGPTVMTFKALDPSRHQELTGDLIDLWNENNISTDGKAHAKGEYLEVIATKR